MKTITKITGLTVLAGLAIAYYWSGQRPEEESNLDKMSHSGWQQVQYDRFGGVEDPHYLITAELQANAAELKSSYSQLLESKISLFERTAIPIDAQKAVLEAKLLDIHVGLGTLEDKLNEANSATDFEQLHIAINNIKKKCEEGNRVSQEAYHVDHIGILSDASLYTTPEQPSTSDYDITSSDKELIAYTKQVFKDITGKPFPEHINFERKHLVGANGIHSYRKGLISYDLEIQGVTLLYILFHEIGHMVAQHTESGQDSPAVDIDVSVLEEACAYAFTDVAIAHIAKSDEPLARGLKEVFEANQSRHLANYLNDSFEEHDVGFAYVTVMRNIYGNPAKVFNMLATVPSSSLDNLPSEVNSALLELSLSEEKERIRQKSRFWNAYGTHLSCDRNHHTLIPYIARFFDAAARADALQLRILEQQFGRNIGLAGGGSVAYVDLDGDGEAEIVEATKGDIKLHTGSGPFAYRQPIVFSAPNGTTIFDTRYGDFDGDGIKDFGFYVVDSSASREPQFHLAAGKGDGTFAKVGRLD